ncbi:MAG: hypothetical protein K8S87_05110 [Planctomycetes bacterium]|nr:hypothetical protein [Planctomycetota bacterium]
MILNNPVGYGEDVKPAEKVKPAEELATTASYDLKHAIGLPGGFDTNFLTNLGTMNTQPLKEKPEQLKELPEGLKNPVFIKVTFYSIDFFGVISTSDGKRIDKLYVDVNHDGKLDETPAKAVYSNYRTNFTQAHFELMKIKIKEKEYGFFLRYYSNKFINRQTKQPATYSNVSYGIVNSYVTNVKIGKDIRKLVVVDKMADGKLRLFGRTGDVIFLDADGDGKFGWASGASETIDGAEFISGGFQYYFKFDLEKKKVIVTSIKLTFGKILFNIKDVNNLAINLAKGLNYNAPQIRIPIKDGIGMAPVGKFIVKNVSFDKDGKKYKLIIRSYSVVEMITITKEKPVKFDLDLIMKFTISEYKYGDQVEGKKLYRMMGYVYNRRTFEANGKEVTLETRTQLLVDEKEFAPPVFTIKDGEGKILIKETVGKPFC